MIILEKDTLLGHDKIKASIATNQASTGPKLHHQPSFFGMFNFQLESFIYASIAFCLLL